MAHEVEALLRVTERLCDLCESLASRVKALEKEMQEVIDGCNSCPGGPLSNISTPVDEAHTYFKR